MSGWDLDDESAKVLDIWVSVKPQNEADLASPSTSSTVQAAANTLWTFLDTPPGAFTAEFEDFDNRFARVENALVELCLLHPRSMDWGIAVMYQIIKDAPGDAIFGLGEGSEGARRDLERFFGNYLSFYADGTHGSVGTKPKDRQGAKDPFTVQFTAREVEDHADEVVKKMANIRKNRWKTMIVQCLAARCHVLETVEHAYKQALVNQLVEFLEIQLDISHREWSTIDCVGLLTMLRGSAAYLLSTFPAEERETKRQDWIKGLNSLLSTSHQGRAPEDKADDIRIKSHAALALKNLRAGGLNEPSVDLFDVQYWMF
ncbi:hypothetical protein BU24DRAFT_489206 [Aaosphaeria arxii CBS 175.79]|uniref:Uncharacterized protein n=1 Tax=Aaosphaeria arxii CBS 175.79 TaxID=1450172 RepID=A0A6A5Y3Q6_9PLEO|nr:uncharacterized protein BU24DRAFT_489206 [Aaosphaeria arxii CBS 175.79]KAF2019184.1 hypothetical protein BU24DRAFT_489206 [Aaosphaeria arxii CBS 175.79]